MREIEEQLLLCLAAYRAGTAARVMPAMEGSGKWEELRALAAVHKLESVVCDTLWKDPAFCGGDRQMAEGWRKETVLRAASQMAKTRRFLALAQRMEGEGITYAVVKGALCRALYSQPDLRPSGDEDILVAEGDAERCGRLLEREGFVLVSPGTDSDPVAHWADPASGLNIELHRALFSTKRPADALLNELFSGQLAHTELMEAEWGTLRSFSPTWHFFYLVCHALKHFIFGGFGIRTLCDVVTYFQRYAHRIHRDTVARELDRVGGRVFFEQLLLIAEAHLGFDLAGSGWPVTSGEDPGEMLEDILAAGVYGQATMSRRHSNTMVVHAAEQGRGSVNVWKAAFPPRENLVRRYPVLEKAPILLPALWIHRLGVYGVELLRGRGRDNSPGESIALGKKRIRMLIRYGVIQKEE